jgi:hypothetical protein
VTRSWLSWSGAWWLPTSRRGSTCSVQGAGATREPGSDYDLLMVFDKLEAPAYRISQEAHELVWGLDISADILVWARDDFDRRLSLKASLPATVVREGMLLHVA